MKRAAGPKGKADVLFSRIVRARGYCQRCGVRGVPLQCAHIIPRRYSHVRTDERNAWSLCAGCHRYLDDHAFEKVAFAFQTIGEDTYTALREKAYSRHKFDWLAEVERLKATPVEEHG